MRAWLPLLLIAVAAPLAGCGGAKDSEADRLVVRTETATVLVSRPREDSMYALIDGAVAVKDGCLALDDNVMIWPPGTTVVREEPLTIEVPGIGRLHVGSHVELGGGYLPDRDEVPLDELDLGPDVPAACAQDSIWLAGPSG